MALFLNGRGFVRTKIAGSTQQGSLHSSDPISELVSRPPLRGVAFELTLNGLHLGVHIVKIVQQDGLWNHGKLWRAEFVLPMMAENEMLDQQAEFRRKVGDALEFLLNHADTNGDVPQELAFHRVAEAGSPREFAQLDNVVQDYSGKQQIAVDRGVVSRGKAGDPEERNNVLQQSADPRMMHPLGCWRLPQSRCDFLVVEEAGEQGLEMRIREAGDIVAQFQPQGVDVFGCLWQEIAEIELALRSAPNALDLELQAAIKATDMRLDLDYLALLKEWNALGDVVPHAPLRLPCLVRQDEREVRIAVLLGANLLLGGDEERRDLLLFMCSKVRYVYVFHLLPGWPYCCGGAG